MSLDCTVSKVFHVDTYQIIYSGMLNLCQDDETLMIGQRKNKKRPFSQKFRDLESWDLKETRNMIFVIFHLSEMEEFCSKLYLH